MSETDPFAHDPDDNEIPSIEDAHINTYNDQSARPFFALLSFLVAIVLLAVFINNPLDGFSRFLVLAALIAFGMIGMVLLDKKHITNHPPTSIESEEEPDEEISEEDNAEELPELSLFEELVREALASMPDEFQQQMQNLVVIVEDEAGADVLARAHVEEGSLLLGLYSGVPLTSLGSNRQVLPERITIYQRPIEAITNNDPDLIRARVHQTVLHEVAHHFGMGHEEMPIWLR